MEYRLRYSRAERGCLGERGCSWQQFPFARVRSLLASAVAPGNIFLSRECASLAERVFYNKTCLIIKNGAINRSTPAHVKGALAVHYLYYIIIFLLIMSIIEKSSAFTIFFMDFPDLQLNHGKSPLLAVKIAPKCL